MNSPCPCLCSTVNGVNILDTAHQFIWYPILPSDDDDGDDDDDDDDDVNDDSGRPKA
jgi:hypothetical protein